MTIMCMSLKSNGTRKTCISIKHTLTTLQIGHLPISTLEYTFQSHAHDLDQAFLFLGAIPSRIWAQRPKPEVFLKIDRPNHSVAIFSTNVSVAIMVGAILGVYSGAGCVNEPQKLPT